MFATIMETVLVKHLGKYLDGIKNNMDISLISGNVTIQNISLRPEFINQLGLPFTLKFSHISKILINVPWTNLKDKPTTVNIQGIYFLLALKHDDMEDNYIDPIKRIKEIGARIRLQLKKKFEDKDSNNKSETFAQKSLIRIIDNLVLNIDQIHIRIQSIKRNWDFSIGLLIDKISSFTVNDFGQKTFYTRHFTNKQANLPLKKSFNCGRFEIYFNDEEDFFLSWQIERGKQNMIKLLSQPFGVRAVTTTKSGTNIFSKMAKTTSQISTSSLPETKNSYKIKTMSMFAVDIVIQQKFSADKKYRVEANVQLPKIELKISDRQFAQLCVMGQLFYEWMLDIQKNGRTTSNFNEKIQQYFKYLILKVAKEQKLTEVELRDLQKIVSENTLNQLQNVADVLIRDCRIQKEMKKINKVSNKDKSQKMVERMLNKIDNENQEIFQLFQHITILINLPQFKISCLKEEITLLSIGLISINSEIKLILNKNTFVQMHVSQFFLQETHPTQRNLVIFSDSQHIKQPFIQFSLSKANSLPPITKLLVKKRQLLLKQQNLQHFVGWFMLIKLKPPLINFIDEQMNYSIHITQQIFNALFSHNQSSLNLRIEIPIIFVEPEGALDFQINLGSFQVRRQSHEEYIIQVVEEQYLKIDGQEIVKFKEGNAMSLLNRQPQAVEVAIQDFQVYNIPTLLKFVQKILRNPLQPILASFSPMEAQQIVFEGEFLLNEFVQPQKMIMKGNHLKFQPSGTDIYLLRTKMYPFFRKGNFGLVFREQVEKTINIVMMQSQKTMQTLFIRMKEHMLYICTLAQWKKYYQNFPDTLVTQLHTIQYTQDNKKLIDLIIYANLCQLDIEGQPDPIKLSLQKLKAQINYKQYNTDASGQIGSISLAIGKEKLIQNFSIKGMYSHIQFMTVQIAVSLLKLNILDYSVVEQLVATSSVYALKFNPIIKEVKNLSGQSQPVLKQQQITTKPVQEKKYLLQTRLAIDLQNLQANIIGYKNSVKLMSFQLLKHRGDLRPCIIIQANSIVLMTLLTFKILSVELDGSNLSFQSSGVGFNLSTQLLLYELTSGKAQIFLNSLINLLNTRKQIKQQNQKYGKKEKHNLKCMFKLNRIRLRIKLTEQQQIILKLNRFNAILETHASDKNSIVLDGRWDNLGLILWDHSILQPLTGQFSINDSIQNLNIGVKFQPLIINVPIHSLAQSISMLMSIVKKIQNIPLIKTVMSYGDQFPLHAPPKTEPPHIKIQASSVKIKLLNNRKATTLKIKVDFPTLSTKIQTSNSVYLQIQHMNPHIKIFQPILQKTQLNFCVKEGPQILLQTEAIRINISEVFIQNILREVLTIKKCIQSQQKQFADYCLQGNEVEKIKKIVNSIIQSDYTEEEQLQYEQHILDEAITNDGMILTNEKEEKKQMYIQNQKSIQVRNLLTTQALVEIKIDEKKTNLHLNGNWGTVYFRAKAEYKQSYQMIQKYKRVLVKLSILNQHFSAQSLYFLIFLHSRSYFYQPVVFFDLEGEEIRSAVGLNLTEQEDGSGEYGLKIVSPFKVINQTSMQVSIKWEYKETTQRNKLKEGQQMWISPWSSRKIGIYGNQQENLYSSPFVLDLFCRQSSHSHEINMNKHLNEEINQYALLAIEREPFELHKSVEADLVDTSIIPGNIFIRPAVYIVNYFHFPVSINGTNCQNKKWTPLYSLYREGDKTFVKVRLGDGSMHEVYLPSVDNYNQVQLKLRDENFIVMSILHTKTSSPNIKTANKDKNITLLHLYGHLQLMVTLPKLHDLTLSTTIYGHRYRLKKQIELVQGYEVAKPSPTNCRDKFLYNTTVSILGQFEKYLTIKINHSGKTVGINEITLYPSYYGDQLILQQLPTNRKSSSNEDNEKKEQEIQQQKEKTKIKFSIDYDFIKIHDDIVMYYVNIIPRCYVLNLSESLLNVDGQGILRHKERIVINSELTQISCIDSEYQWQLLNEDLVINLEIQREIVFFKEILFQEHQLAQDVRITSQQGSEGKQHANKKITLDTSHLNILRVMRHRGSSNTTTYCLEDWQEDINIYNHLKVPLTVTSVVCMHSLQITLKTVILPNQNQNHPYGLEMMKNICFWIPVQDKLMLLGQYDINMRINDHIEYEYTPKYQGQPKEKNEEKDEEKGEEEQKNERDENKQNDNKEEQQMNSKKKEIKDEEGSKQDKGKKIQLVGIIQTKAKKGRKISVICEQNIAQNEGEKNFMCSGSLKISEYINIKIHNLGVCVFRGVQRMRQEILKAHLQSILLTVLLYPSGLYILNLETGIRVHAAQLIPPVLQIPKIYFYIEAVQKKFIERVTFKVPEQISVFLTDKFLSEMLKFAVSIISGINKIKEDLEEKPDMPSGIDEVDQFYSSSLNSLSISPIQLQLTLKKILVEDSESQKILMDMGLSIVELESSKINLSNVDIEEPLNTKHLNNVTKMYVMEIIVGCLGGMNLIGNPKQFMEEIQAGKVKGRPVLGVLGGIVAGTANSMSKILSTVSNGISNLSMDHQYQRRRNQSYMVQPKGFFNGVKEGSKTFMYSVKSGVVGLVERPYEGAKQEGGFGFLKGSFQGMAGLIIKPVTGLMDAASMTIHGIQSVSTYLDENSFSSQFSFLIKPLYHKFKVIRAHDTADEIMYNCLLRIALVNEKVQQLFPIALVQAFYLQNEDGTISQQGIVISCQSLFLLNIQSDELLLQIKTDKMIATGKFLEGVVLYFDDGHGEQDQIVFRIQNNVIKKEHLFWTLKAFISLYAQSKDSEEIPD